MTGEQALLLHLTNIFRDRLTSTLLFAQLHVSAGFLRREALLTASYISILDSTSIAMKKFILIKELPRVVREIISHFITPLFYTRLAPIRLTPIAFFDFHVDSYNGLQYVMFLFPFRASIIHYFIYLIQ